MNLPAKLKLVALCACNCNYTYRRLFRQRLQAVSINTDLLPRKLIICYLHISIYAVLYTVHVISQYIDGGAKEADCGASAPVGPSVTTSLTILCYQFLNQEWLVRPWFFKNTFIRECKYACVRMHVCVCVHPRGNK